MQLRTLTERFAQLDVQLRAAPGPMPDEQLDRLIAQWLNLAEDLIATPAEDAHDIAAKLNTLARVVNETGDVEERDLDMLADIQLDMQRLAS